MCIGMPMRVVEAGASTALVQGRGRFEQVDIRLVGACEPGQWLLIFQGAARERLEAQRAAEIEAALDLLEGALAGAAADPSTDPGFALPSAMSAEQLAQLTGGAAPDPGASR
jgi:hydrogenase expression/formation protein HypC